MKTNSIKIHIAAVCMAVISAFCLLPSAFGQGALTPPGAPAPTMKTLTQVEPRTPISSAPFTISAPGSYYLTTNLTGASSAHGITISSGNVTLDLNGFVLQGVSGSQDGVYVGDNYTNITVRNGAITGWGGNGVDAGTTSLRNVLLERLNVSANGFNGLLVMDGVVRDCCCVSNHSIGIYIERGMVSDCVAHDNGGVGIEAINSTVHECHVRNNGLYGIFADYSTVSGCYVSENVQSGIYVNAPSCQIIGNNCLNNNTSVNSGAAGIYINDSNNRVEDNHVVHSGYAGITVVSGYTNNIIVKNTVIGSGTNNYVIPAGQISGPLITTTGTITNSNPWANFSF